MFRLLRDSAQTILLALMYVKYVKGLDSSRTLREIYQMERRTLQAGTIPPELDTAGSAAIRELQDHPDPPMISQIIELIANQLTTPRGATEDKDLIDILVESMKLPFTGRRLGTGDRAKAIQKAILTPNELGMLRETLQKGEFFCSSCAMPLRSGELITFHASEGTETPQLYCYRCQQPQWVACQACMDNVMPIDRKFYVGMSTQCERHIAKKQRITFKTVPEPAVFDLQAGLLEMELNMPIAAPPTGLRGTIRTLDELDNEDEEGPF